MTLRARMFAAPAIAIAGWFTFAPIAAGPTRAADAVVPNTTHAVDAVAPGGAAPTGSPAMPEMSRYVFGVLRKGPQWTPGSSQALDSLQQAHLAHLTSMWEAGALVAAGPVAHAGDWRGLLIFRADSTAPTRALAERDPAVRAGRLQVDLWPWFAPAGIGKGYARRKERMGDRADSMVTRWVALLNREPAFGSESSPEREALQRRHLGHILGEIAAGRAPASGPLETDADPIGICVFATDSLTAWTRANADPAVASGRIRIQMIRWWCAYGVLPGEE